MAVYPGGIKSFPTYANGDFITPTVANDPDAEITAIETGLLNGFAHDLKSDATANHRSLGTSGNQFWDLYLADQANVANGIVLADAVPSPTTATLYQTGGLLYFGDAPVTNVVKLDSRTFTNSSGAQSDVLTIALTGLSTLDTLRVELAFYATGGASGIWLRSATDALDMWGSASGGNNLGNSINSFGATTVTIRLADYVGLKKVGSSAALDVGVVASAQTLTTNWTGSWTLALRFSGTIGTAWGSWTVYKERG